MTPPNVYKLTPMILIIPFRKKSSKAIDTFLCNFLAVPNSFWDNESFPENILFCENLTFYDHWWPKYWPKWKKWPEYLRNDFRRAIICFFPPFYTTPGSRVSGRGDLDAPPRLNVQVSNPRPGLTSLSFNGIANTHNFMRVHKIKAGSRLRFMQQ